MIKLTFLMIVLYIAILHTLIPINIMMEDLIMTGFMIGLEI